MTMERFLIFLINHNTTIIEVLMGCVLFIAAILSIRYFVYGNESTGSHSLGDLSDLESTLKQIIEKAGSVPSVRSGSSEDSQKLISEIEILKKELEAKKKEIEDFKGLSLTTPASVAGMSDEEKAKLESKMKELEAKLAEYEIISEDIADLSFYKEQNVKLQKEIDSLKANGGGAAPAQPSSVATQEIPPVAAEIAEAKADLSDNGIVEKTSENETGLSAAEEPREESKTDNDSSLNSLQESAPALSAVTEDTPPSSSEGESSIASIDDELMAEFAAAVAKQLGEKEAPKESVPETPVPESNSKMTEVAPVSSEKSHDEQDDTATLGQMDIDRMLQESAAIQEPDKEISIDEAIGSSMDENKLLQEAAAMTTISNEDQALMGQFENYVKKNEG